MMMGIHPLADFLADLAKLISGVSVRWVNCHPDICQRIYFANHTSHLDFVVLWAALPKEIRVFTRPIAAKDYWGSGRLRYYLATKVFNAVLIERGSANISECNKTIDLMLEAMGDRYSLIIFPEGTRSTREEVGVFKSGLYYLTMARPDVELIPVYIDNLNRILPKGEFLPVPMLSCISLGPPIRVLKGESKDAFLVRAREAICNLKQ